MKRIFIFFFFTIILLSGIAIALFYANTDKITAVISQTVEDMTGNPLSIQQLPTISLFPKPGIQIETVTWGDPIQSTISVSIKKCIVQPSILKLLSGVIDIKNIYLDTPKIHINKHSKSSKLSHPKKINNAQESSKKEQASTIPDINISSCTIKNGSLTFVEKTTQIYISEIFISAKNISPSNIDELSIKLSTQMQTEKLNAAIQSTSSVRITPQSITLQNLSTNIKLPKYVTSPIDITAHAITYHFNENTCTLSNVTTSIEQFSITANGSINPSIPKGTLTCSLKGSINDFAHNLGFIVEIPDPKALEIFSAQALLKFTKDQYSFSNIQLNSYKTKATGSLNIKKDKSFSGTLAVTRINLDNYIPFSITKKDTSIAQNPNPTPDKNTYHTTKKQYPHYPKVDFTLHTESLTASNLTINNLHATIRGSQKKYTLSPCTFNFYESPTSINGTVLLSEQNHTYTIQLLSPKIQLQPLLTDIAKTSTIQKGQLGLQATLTALGPSTSDIKKTLTGTIKLTGKDIIIHFGAIPTQIAELTKIGKQKFADLIGSIAIKNGVLDIQEFALKGSLISTSTTGNILLPQETLDITNTITVTKTLAIPIRVFGPLANPSYRLNPITAITGNINQILETGKTEILDKVIPSSTKDAIKKSTKKLFDKLRWK